MPKKKVTLSLDTKIYSNFQKYCEEHAIMLSKRIELFMREVLKLKGKKFLFFFLFFFTIHITSATIIFSDDFESGSLAGWNLTTVENNWTVVQTDPYEGLSHAEANPKNTNEPASVMQINISTTGYENITFSYYRKLIGLDPSDEFQVEWHTGVSWVILEETGTNSANDPAYIYMEFNLSSIAGNNPGLQIKFECTAGAVSEYCRVDNVSLAGNVISGGGGDDTTPPIVNLISPANGTTITLNTTFFKARFSDNVNVSNATLYVWNSTNDMIGTNFTVLGNSSISANLSFILPNVGTYFWNYWAFDNSTNSAWNDTNFTLVFSLPDVNAPTVVLLSPANATIVNDNITFFAAYFSDNVNLSNATLHIWNASGVQIGSNFTNLGNSSIFKNLSFALPKAGVYYWNYEAVDNSSNRAFNETNFTFTLSDTTPPDVTNLIELPSDPATYSHGANYKFNATVIDNMGVDTVILSFNGSNYTTTNISSNFSASVNDLPAGNYGYYWYVNDTSGNVNQSESGTYTVDRAAPIGSITGTSAITYGVLSDIEGVESNQGDGDVVYRLYREGIEVSNPDNTVLAAGNYDYIFNSTEGQNYSADAQLDTFALTVNKASGVVYLYLNGSRENITIAQGFSVFMNATLINGQFGIVNLTLDNTQLNASTSENVTFNYTFGSLGGFVVRANYSGNTNYTSSVEEWNVTVIAAPDTTVPLVTINFPSNTTYGPANIPLKFNVSLNENGSARYSLDEGMSNFTMTNSSGGVIGTLLNATNASIIDGSYRFSVYANDTSGNNNFTEYVDFSVDTTAPTVSYAPPTESSGAYLNRDYILINVTASDTNLTNITVRLYNSTHAQIGINITMTSPNYVNYSSLNDEVYFFNATAVDLVGNMNSTRTRNVTVDTTIPLVSYESGTPEDFANLTQTSVFVNISVTETNFMNITFLLANSTAIVNSTTYTTLGKTINWTGLALTNYSYNVTVYDSAGNVNATVTRRVNLSSSLDMDYPRFSSFATSPANNTAYLFGALYRFNSTVTSTNVTVGIEFNNVNYTSSNISSSVFNVSVSNLAAGTYGYYWWGYGNGTNNNFNRSSDRSYTVAKAGSEVNLTLNHSEGNITLSQGSSIWLNVSVVSGESYVGLYFDGGLINNGTNAVANLSSFNSVGMVNVTAVYFVSQNYSISSESYFVNVTSVNNNAPSVRVNSPANNSNITASSVILNATVYDIDLNNLTVWFYGKGVLLNTTYNMSNGSILLYNWSGLVNGNYNWSVIASDNAVNSTEEIFFFSVNLTGTAPNVRINYPTYASTYKNANNISLNFSAVSNNLDSCWYTTNEGAANVTLINCANSSFAVVGNGVYNLSVYANESLSGKIGNDNLTFYVDTDGPTIHLTVPNHKNYTNVSDVVFSYVPSFDVAVDNCSFYGDFNGSYGLNQSDLSIVGVAENNFALNLSEGSYSWAVDCNAGGNYSITGNRTLFVDATAPNVTLSNSIPAVVSSDTVNFEYSINDTSPTTCTFIVNATSSGTIVFSNITRNCDNIILSFSVSGLSDGGYESIMTAEDVAGNLQVSKVIFKIVTSSGGSSPGSGGGGGTTGDVVLVGPRDIRLDISLPENILIRRGRTETISLDVQSKDAGFINNCKLKFAGSAADWFSSEQVEGFSPGEKVVYEATVNVPEKVEPSSYNVNVAVECDEGSVESSFELVVFVNDFEIEIGDYARDKSKLKVFYNLQEFVGRSHQISVEYVMVDLDGIVRFNGKEEVSLDPYEDSERVIEFELPKDSFGEFDFRMRATEGEIELITNKKIFLPSGGLAGFAISEDNMRVLSWIGVVVVLLLVGFFVYRLSRRFYKKTRQIGHLKRRFIKLKK